MGWDTTHLKGSGNIFLYMDRNHADPVVQGRLADELEGGLKTGQFSVLLCEGCEGRFSTDYSGFADEDSFRQQINTEFNREPFAIELVAYRHPGIEMIGVDNAELLGRQRKIVSQIAGIIGQKGLDRNDSLLDEAVRVGLASLHIVYSIVENLRTMHALEEIIGHMDGSRNIGLVFGNGHSAKFTEGFRDAGIGYAVFDPGVPQKDYSRDLGYVMSFLK
jgi:hypothetical protein